MTVVESATMAVFTVAVVFSLIAVMPMAIVPTVSIVHGLGLFLPVLSVICFAVFQFLSKGPSFAAAYRINWAVVFTVGAVGYFCVYSVIFNTCIHVWYSSFRFVFSAILFGTL